jgi:mono/diheme cytochrome c family protein
MTTTRLRPRPLTFSLAGIAVAAIATVALAQTPKPEAAKETRLERGKYLVEEVSRCQECHTPILPDGSFDKANWMKGATLVGIPAKPIEDWHQKAPDITSTSKLWTNWKYEGFVAFLQTAKNPRGHKAGPPMPAYTLKPEDAEAMAAYLKSLP